MNQPLKIIGITSVAALFLALAPTASAGVSVSINLGGGYHRPQYRPHCEPVYSYGRPVYMERHSPYYYRPAPVVVYAPPRVVYVPTPSYGYGHGYGSARDSYRRHCR